MYSWLGGPQSRSGRVWKISNPKGFDPRTVQPVASGYTDYAIPPPLHSQYGQQVILVITLSTLPTMKINTFLLHRTQRDPWQSIPCLYISTNFNSSHCNKNSEESTFLNLQTNISIQTPATSKRASEIVSATKTIYVT